MYKMGHSVEVKHVSLLN